jgi:hypothetical protein
MDLLQTINTLLLASAGCAGVYAVGRLFYVAGTAPTTVYPRETRTGPMIFPGTAMANAKEYSDLLIRLHGHMADVKGEEFKQPKEQLE